MRFFPLLSAGTACLMTLEVAAQGGSYAATVEASVVDVSPIYEIRSERIPVEDCRNERVQASRPWWDRSFTPAVLGAVVGGSAASVLGRNSSRRDVITGAGAVLGASVGNDIGRRRSAMGDEYVTQQVCSTRYELREREQLGGYRVRYRYDGRIYETRTATDPGDTIILRTRLEPLS